MQRDWQEKIEKAFASEEVRLAPYTEKAKEVVSLKEISSRMQSVGFAIVQIDSLEGSTDLPAHKVAPKLGELLNLGEPYIPVQYTPEEVEQFYTDRVNKIYSGDTKQHTNFYSATNQKIHTDGTLDPLNAVRTAMLYCHHPAKEGGENTVYNMLGALFDLYQEDKELALALFDKIALTKFSPSNPALDEMTDSAFGFDEQGRIVTRYSDSDEFCRWSDDPVIQQALTFMRGRLVSSDAPLRNIEFKLKAGEVLVLANTKVAHGRDAFTVDPENPREMWRALFSRDIDYSTE